VRPAGRLARGPTRGLARQIAGGLEVAAQHPKAFEEHAANQAGLVAEQLVDRGGSKSWRVRDIARGELGEAFVGQELDGDLQDVVASAWVRGVGLGIGG